MDKARILALAGLKEDYDQDAADAALEREQHIEKLIRHAFAKAHLPIDSGMSAVMYDDATREATVTLEEEPRGYPIERLVVLASSGIGADIRMTANGDRCVEITFKVPAELDHAQIS